MALCVLVHGLRKKERRGNNAGGIWQQAIAEIILPYILDQLEVEN